MNRTPTPCPLSIRHLSKSGFSYIFSGILVLCPGVVFAQSKIPGAPSNAPPRVDLSGRADGIADKIENVFENINMVANFVREAQIKNTILSYLNDNGIKPEARDVHVFYVRAETNDSNAVYLKDYQYLAKGKGYSDAMRESFAVEDAPGTVDRLDAVRKGMHIIGIYVTASSENGQFEIRGGSLSGEQYNKFRTEGLALRDERAKEKIESDRIQRIRQERAATHSSGQQRAVNEINRANERSRDEGRYVPKLPSARDVIFGPRPDSPGQNAGNQPQSPSASDSNRPSTTISSSAASRPVVSFDAPTQRKNLEPKRGGVEIGGLR
ncbi:hypothetical protein SAMN02799636_04289 [Methylobacterium sp. 275MFSha3.1]|uniref:hypothetical protein n=1 Tax=Methylobacterium sp. 275MFSha3.1 TaxID=1502746 RepID=UPI0008A7D95B|nr:hypothetical protein [Methylobacterium sp. 275MFSha3.1]SEH88718.1 hypothetical protein SAMN02799636_04289 [Methylobacterium sp. 275MFSha3.1]